MGFLTTRERMGIAAVILAASNLLSRLMGLVRDKVISWQFGTGEEADLYFAAFVVPDCINYLLAGGFLSITLIPLLSRAEKSDVKSAWALFSCVTTWMALGSTILTVLCMVFADRLALLVAPGFSEGQCARLAFFMRIILPAQIFFLTGSCTTALLMLRRQFRVPALTPLIYNGTIIAGGLLLPLFVSIAQGIGYAEASARVGMTGYCIGVTLGAFLGAFLLPVSAAKAGSLCFRPRLTHPLMKNFCCIALPLMLGQTIIMLDEQLLRIFGSFLSEGSVSLLAYARRISQVPVGLVGQAAAVASYPFLVRLVTEGNRQAIRETITTALRTTLALGIPCAAYLAATAWSVITILFYGGRFGADDCLASVPILRILLAGVPVLIFYMILARAYYAHENTITPALTGTVCTLFALPVYWYVSHGGSPAGLAATSVCSIAVYVVWLHAIWVRRYTRLDGLPIHAARVAACTLPAAGAVYLAHDALLKHSAFHPVMTALLCQALSAALFLLIFLPLAAILLPDMMQRILSKLKRSRKGPEE